MLTEEQKAAYARDGYITVPGVFSPERVGQLSDATDRVVEASRSVTEHDDVYDLEPDHSAASPRLRRIKFPERVDPAYAAALHDAAVLDIVSELVGTAGVRFNGTKLNLKARAGGSAVEWHQDWAFYPHTNDDLLAVGVAIDAMTADNGCLLMIPGSHRGPVFDHHQDGRFVGAVNDPAFDASTAREVLLNAGDISVHHVRTAHASAPNTSDQPRRLLLLMYCATDAYPVVETSGEAGGWEAYSESFLRGEPSPTIRSTAVPMRLPLPPPLASGSIFETQSKLQRAGVAAMR
jgi:phytanoyl-CoA hydroxylase